MARNFAMAGVAGYIAPRHLRAIKETGNQLVAAVDPHDSVGILDQYWLNVRFFTEFERFDRHLEKLRRGPEEQRVHYLSICSPNYLHDAHCRLALRVGAVPICEKPLVINPWNLDALQELELEFSRRIYTVLQLRLHPKLIDLKNLIGQESGNRPHHVTLTYVTARGAWYHVSWKGFPQKSGGIATNIGIHFFDLLLWVFGRCSEYRVYHSDPYRMAGSLELERACVKWFLSVDANDVPSNVKREGQSTFRSISVDDSEIEFTEGFADLHTRAYEETLAGRGFGIEDARPSIELAYRIRTANLSKWDNMVHPWVSKSQHQESEHA